MKAKNNGAVLAQKSSKEVGRSRDAIMRDIKVGWEQFQNEITQVERRFKWGLGGLFNELRATFASGRNGDLEFEEYCGKHASPLKPQARREWMRYAKALEIKPSRDSKESRPLPPLRSVTHKKPEWRTRDELRRRVKIVLELPHAGQAKQRERIAAHIARLEEIRGRMLGVEELAEEFKKLLPGLDTPEAEGPNGD